MTGIAFMIIYIALFTVTDTDVGAIDSILGIIGAVSIEINNWIKMNKFEQKKIKQGGNND